MAAVGSAEAEAAMLGIVVKTHAHAHICTCTFIMPTSQQAQQKTKGRAPPVGRACGNEQ